MLGSKGNPQASNLFAVIHWLQEQNSIHLEAKPGKRPMGLCGSAQ
jgi:hypothetical protein